MKKRKFITLVNKAEMVIQVEKGKERMYVTKNAASRPARCPQSSRAPLFEGKKKAPIIGMLENGVGARSKTWMVAVFPDVDKVVSA